MRFKDTRIWHFLQRTTILKVSLFNAVSVVFRVIFAYITNKIIVIFLGPSGTALTEQMKNFIQAVQGISTMGLNEGVIRYSSLYQYRHKRLIGFLSATYKLIFYTSLALMLIVLIFAPQINDYLFPDRRYIVLIYIAGLLIPIYAMQLILLAVLQGFQEYKKVTYIVTIIYAVSTLLTFLLVWHMKMTGALIAVIFTPVISLVIILGFVGNNIKQLLLLPLGNGHVEYQSQYFKRLLPYIWMAGITAVIIPVSTIAIRNLIINHFGDEGVVHAGYWDAIRKISAFYFMFITPVFSMYYFPRISKYTRTHLWRNDLKEMILKFYPFVFAGLFLIWVLRRHITLIIFSHEYEPMNDLYGWQILGDVIRLFSLLVAYKFWVHAMVNRYLFAEISYWAVYYFLSSLLIKPFDLLGVMYAYGLANIFYLITVVFLLRKKL